MLNDYIEGLKKEQAKTQRELSSIEELRMEFPDLEVDTDRWGRKRYMAKSANQRVTEVMFHRNCGCCTDSPVHARPYLKLSNGTYVYSSPCNVMVGEPLSWGNGFKEYDGWRKAYEEAGINPAIVEQIQNYVDQHMEEDDEGDEDDNGR